MATFSYRGRKRDGQLVDGRLEASSASACAARLTEDGIIPLSVQEQIQTPTTRTKKKSLPWQRERVELVELVMFSRQMYTLTRAGVPILGAFTTLADSSSNPYFGRILREVAEHIASGQDLTSAMSRYPKVFSQFYISMINVGENTGRLDQAFVQLATQLESDFESRKRIASAMRYPTLVLIFIVGAIAIINLMVVPEFAKLFASFKSELPLPTRILMATSRFFVEGWPYLLVAIVGGGYAWQRYLQTTAGRLYWDERKLYLPLIGDIVHRSLLGRFARSFATMVRAGVPLPTALAVISRVVDNAFVGSRIMQMRDGIERGESITRNAAATNMFSPLVLQMMAVGEETGALDELLAEVADFYDREVDYDLKRLTDRLEPIMIVFMGVLVLILALGVFLPLWNMAGAARGGT